MLNRRKFLGLGLGAIAVASTSNLGAEDFRKSKPKAWTATKVDEAIKEVFGKTAAVESNITLSAPDIAENGAVIPISFKTDLKATKIAVFQDANPEATVAVYTITPNMVLDYAFRIKMQQTGDVIIIAEANGQLYKAVKNVKVTIGGCGG
ncbi:sulfur oxidation protein SoxY [Aliarcobacter thereius]|uniref:Sulfur oxidation protein SoxY n=2 Tax=Aliarcobacter thereius TaxID=544718 RepID=A0A1C0B7X2_9BACT|nr:thiosulfate oxidation carrier protein SoxY [Aliarcobacter thereius]OCL87771.1 sulfur oxidation protein SoxY [Aliarcobacter thereius]OCL94028.1 sulfur oxidation protein SoxY [Aliarcobacter thereius]OCL95422.1 sulfur oxidation protein SoxY [Aliarcobacter thereius LMG 24486]OCL99684.1 sulfur oxidation protein SoxY [Aliarcobacter thereius]QBF16590.1 sulfur oxidation protein SoxYZ, sulfur covalently binding protein [Aliarcobacter thereius LMG 24486]